MSINPAADGKSVPLTPMQLRLWLLSALGVALDGFDFFIIGVALPLIQRDLQPAAWEVGAIGAAAVLGAALGAVALGPITDKLGRRAMYTFDLMFFIVFALLSACAWDVLSLILFRFLLGVGIGADYPISATYVAETMPSRLRGRMVSSTIAFQAVGMIAGALVGVLLLQVVKDDSAWRWMLAVGALPALLIAALRSSMPESPRWLAAHGRAAEAEAACTSLIGPGDVGRSDMTLAGEDEKPVAYRELLSPRLLRRTCLATVPWFLMDVATYGIGVFTPVVLAALTARPAHHHFISHEIVAAESAAFVDLFLLAGFGLGVLLIDRVGRIPLQVVGFIAMAVSLAALASTASGPVGGTEHTALVFGGFIVFNLFMNMGPNTTTYVLPAEIFPTRLRASAHGLAAAAGKLGATVGIFFLPILQKNIGLGATLGAVAAAAGLGAVTTWVFRVEPTGCSLQQFE